VVFLTLDDILESASTATEAAQERKFDTPLVAAIEIQNASRNSIAFGYSTSRLSTRLSALSNSVRVIACCSDLVKVA